MEILMRWLVSALVVFVAAYVLPGVHVDNFVTALAVAVILGVVNAIIRPILILLTLPIALVTLGLFIFIINATLILLTDVIIPGFSVDSFWWALLFSLLLSLMHSFLTKFSRNY